LCGAHYNVSFTVQEPEAWKIRTREAVLETLKQRFAVHSYLYISKRTRVLEALVAFRSPSLGWPTAGRSSKSVNRSLLHQVSRSGAGGGQPCRLADSIQPKRRVSNLKLQEKAPRHLNAGTSAARCAKCLDEFAVFTPACILRKLVVR
jgi:hypothetical protein